MAVSHHTLEALQNLPSHDALLLDKLYAVTSLEQAVDIVADSARRLCVAIDRGELATYLQNAVAVPGLPD